MSNLINPSVLAFEALDQLQYELVAGNLLYRDMTQDFSPVRGHKVGDTITIRTNSEARTDEFTGTTIPQEVDQSGTTLTIEKHFDHTRVMGAQERALNLDGIRQEIINPAMKSLAQKADKYLLTKITQGQGLYSSTTLLEDAADIAQAKRQAGAQQIDTSMRIGLLNDELAATLQGKDVFSRFDYRGQPGVTALQEGTLGRLMGIDWFESYNMPTDFRTLIGDGTTTLDNALATSNLQGSNTLVVDATVGTYQIGDKIEIAGAKRAFTAAAQVTVGATAISIVEQINEDLSALDGNAVTVIGSGATSIDTQGVIFNPDAFGFAMPALDDVSGSNVIGSVATGEGLSVRFVEDYNSQTKTTNWSFDLLIGAAARDARKALVLGKQV